MRFVILNSSEGFIAIHENSTRIYDGYVIATSWLFLGTWKLEPVAHLQKGCCKIPIIVQLETPNPIIRRLSYRDDHKKRRRGPCGSANTWTTFLAHFTSGTDLELCRFLKMRNHAFQFILPVCEMRSCESENNSFLFQFQINCWKWPRNRNHNTLGIGIGTALDWTDFFFAPDIVWHLLDGSASPRPANSCPRITCWLTLARWHHDTHSSFVVDMLSILPSSLSPSFPALSLCPRPPLSPCATQPTLRSGVTDYGGGHWAGSLVRGSVTFKLMLR